MSPPPSVQVLDRVKDLWQPSNMTQPEMSPLLGQIATMPHWEQYECGVLSAEKLGAAFAGVARAVMELVLTHQLQEEGGMVRGGEAGRVRGGKGVEVREGGRGDGGYS